MELNSKHVFFGAIILILAVVMFSRYNSGMSPHHLRRMGKKKEGFDEIKPEIITDPEQKAGEESGYKPASYRDGVRGGYSPNIDNFFEKGSPLAEIDTGFKPNDETHSAYSAVPSASSTKMTEEEKFDASQLLPTEVKKDWFEDVQGIAVNNTHLVNVYRPYGINTTQSSLKNPYRDYRGEPVISKTIISPFNNSSYEPDYNIRDGAICGLNDSTQIETK
jgi:hypothetical protein